MMFRKEKPILSLVQDVVDDVEYLLGVLELVHTGDETAYEMVEQALTHFGLIETE